jgi:nitroreductase
MPRNAAVADYLKTRRSVGIGFLAEPGPTPTELEEILTIATRVPDHGKFTPWRLVLFEGDARLAAGEKLAEIKKLQRPDIDEASLEIERREFLPAPLTIGVLLSPKPNPKAPEIEQLLSAGNVCFNLEHAANALGFAATWHSRWYAFDPVAQQALGARGGERFVGFIHIGTPTIVPEDRPRPALADVVTRWQPA